MATEVQPRGRSNRLIMVLGILIALICAVAIFLFGRGGGTTQGNRTQDVVVAAVALQPGQQLTAQLLVTIKYAPEQLPVGFHAKPADLINKFAVTAIPKNQPITDSDVIGTAPTALTPRHPYLDIPKGQVAIAIPGGGELQAVAGFIQQDDRVDLLATGLPGEHAGTWKTILTNVRIQHVGPFVAGAGSAVGLTSSYILYVPLEQAEDLSYLFNNGTYKFVLKAQADAQPGDNLTPGTAGTGANKDTFNPKYNVPQ